jgi:hypothetical protein
MRLPSSPLARAWLTCAPLLAAVSFAPRAAAQSNSALAEKLFLEGQKLMLAGDPTACEKLADSERLDPALGTLMNLALCHEKRGKNATAWGEFTDAAAKALRLSQRDREEFARSHAAALEKKLQKVIVEIPTAPPGMDVRLDGVSLPLTVLGTEIPLDPGDHELTVSAPGKRPWRQAKLNLGPSAVITRVAVTLEDAGPSSPPPGQGVVPPPPPPGAAPGEDATSSSAGKRAAGFIVAGVGLAGVAAGAVMLGLASSLSHRADSEQVSGQPGVALNDHNAALDDQTAGLIAGGAGIVALGVGAFLIFTSGPTHPSPRSVTALRGLRVLPRIGPGGVGLDVGATF